MSSKVGGSGLGGPYGKGPQAPKGPTRCMQKQQTVNCILCVLLDDFRQGRSQDLCLGGAKLPGAQLPGALGYPQNQKTMRIWPTIFRKGPKSSNEEVYPLSVDLGQNFDVTKLT